MSWIFLLPVIAIVLGTIIKAFGTTPSQSLNNKFISLGTISGKTYNEIITVVGGLETLPGERCEPIKVYGDVQSLPYMWQGEESYNDTLKVDLRNKPVNSITNFILQR